MAKAVFYHSEDSTLKTVGSATQDGSHLGLRFFFLS